MTYKITLILCLALSFQTTAQDTIDFESFKLLPGKFLNGSDAPGFFDAAGIESPGLSSAPAIGVTVAELVRDLLNAEEKSDFNPVRHGILDPDTLSLEERNQLIKENPAYGNIICRCEMITEGEILDAIHRPLGAHSLDGVKRRTRAGMGRCQSGFCSPKVMEILERVSKEWAYSCL